ncbi:uncharacterized protein DDB_G0284459-like isoform X2 [Bolinopsis microptera]|uniref:uncharacterized protein DDB_G0284459-like isoform X2 n=1 Tax=Bolinopsis microptera TaxID=2820187 RepID=UPI003078D7C5
MASAVDEVSSALGLSQSSNPGDDLKSPEQHQASMFAARQQLQAKHKDSSSFPTTSSGTKKVAAIKPQFKPLSKKQSSFVTPYIKKEDPIKENPQKLSPQKKPIVKQLDKLREPSPGDTGRQLPTVSSRYHSPSLKRSRGRHNDETIVSDEEIQKAKMIKKSFTSPERKTFSPKPSPKNSPKLSPKMCSPKSRTAGSPNHSPILFHSQTDDLVKDDNDDKEIYTQKTIPQLVDTENNTSSVKSSDTKVQLNSLDNLNHVANSHTAIVTSEQQKAYLNAISYSPEASSSPPANMISLSSTSHSPKESAELISTSNKQQITSHSNEIISSFPNPDTIKEVNPSDSTEKISSPPKPDFPKSESSDPESLQPDSPKAEYPKAEPISSQSSQRSTADVVKSAMDTLHSESRVLVETYHDHCSVELDVKNCCGSGSQKYNEGVGSELDGDVENGLQSKVDDVEECVIENLLTPLEESLSLPSSSEGLVLVEEADKKKGKNKHKGKSKTKTVNSSDEVDRQKVNDFFSNKFGLSFSTPKGADRPKPLLKFARKDESSDADYSTVQSPGKFKSTFRALGNDKVEGKEPDKKKKAAEEKKPVRKAEPMQKQSRKVEQKTKRKIERSPKRPRKEEPKKSLSMSASSSSSSSSSEDSDSDSCMKRSANSSAKSTTKQRENKPTQKKQPPPQKNAKEQKLKIKEETMKAELIRKRKKVYSSSNSSESENDEFTLSCTNSDNLESIWVQCERCSKWRYLRDTSDPNLIPDDWVCTLNPDKKYNNCNAPEESWTQLDQGYEFVYSAYSLGSLVWGKMQGYPWWPGMIDNDPLTRTFYYKHANSQLPDKYHVTFFGIQATRAWIGKKFIKVYNPDDKEDQLKYDQRKSGKGMREAIAMANQAFHLELNDRKKIYGFKEQGKSVEVVPLDNTSKAKATKDRKVVTKTVSAIKKLKPSYVSRLYEKAVLKLSQESQSTHTFHDNHPGGGRGRGRPRKTSAATEKPAKRKKITKRSSDEQSYIATPSRLNSLDVIENIENEINQVLRDCSPSPTGFDH